MGPSCEKVISCIMNDKKGTISVINLNDAHRSATGNWLMFTVFLFVGHIEVEKTYEY